MEGIHRETLSDIVTLVTDSYPPRKLTHRGGFEEFVRLTDSSKRNTVLELRGTREQRSVRVIPSSAFFHVRSPMNRAQKIYHQDSSESVTVIIFYK